MSTIPNRYYNSPWIADAARNLASALAPPDPEKMIARQRAQWEFDRAQQLAQVQDDERARDLGADQALTELFMDEPAVNPVTGQVDDKQTALNRRAIASRAVAGGREYVTPTDALLGPYSPTFESKQILEAVKAAATQKAIDRRFGNQMDIAQYNQGQTNARQDKLFGQQYSMEAFRQTGRFQLQNAHAQQMLAQIQERARTGNGNPMKITGKTLEDLLVYMQSKIDETGAQMPQGYRDELLTRMAIEASKTGNIPLATEQVWADSGLPNGPTELEQPGPVDAILRKLGLTSAPQTLTPNFGQPRPAAPPLGGATSSTETKTTLGGAVAPAYDAAPNGVSQGAYDAALNRTMQTGKPPDFAGAIAQAQAATAPQAAPAPAPAPAPTPAPSKAKAAPAPAAKPPRVPRGSADLPTPKNKQEYDALKSGTKFIDPNGDTRTKP